LRPPGIVTRHPGFWPHWHLRF